jgi:autotransporter family porin
MREMTAGAFAPMPAAFARRQICIVILTTFAPAASALTVIGASTSGQQVSNDTEYVVNAGTTVSSDTGDAVIVNGVAPVAFSNSGSLLSAQASQAAALRFNVAGELHNAAGGRMFGQTFGVMMNGGGAGNNIVNFGDISARISHAIYYGGDSAGTVDNFGSLNGDGAVGASADGIYLHGTGHVTVNNHMGASIASGRGDATYGAAIVIDGGTASIVNDGNMNGYHGGIVSTTTGVVQIDNRITGTIRTTNDAAIQILQGGTIHNAGRLASGGRAAIVLAGGNNSVVLDTGSSIDAGTAILSQGTGNTITLAGTGSEDSSFSATAGNGFASLTAQAGSNWTLSGGAILGGTSAATLHVAGNLSLGGTVFQTAGGGTTIDGGGSLTIGLGGTSGALNGAIVNHGTLTLRRSDAMLVDGVLTGGGTLVQAGTGAATLSAAGSSQGTVSVMTGTLRHTHAGAFATTGNYTTAVGATTSILGPSSLAVGGRFAMDGTLNVMAGGSNPVVGASTAVIGTGAVLNLTGFSASATASASELAATTLDVIRASAPGALSGTFESIRLGGSPSPVDYLTLSSAYGPQALAVGTGLVWYASHSNTPLIASGTFTLAQADHAFDMDAVLADQAPNAATGWDGRTLTKAGPGTLQLSKANTYTGATRIDAGTLRAGAENVVARSEQVALAGGATFDLADFNQRVNDLTGAGNVTLGLATLTLNSVASTAFDGVIGGDGGIDKQGPGSLVLSKDQTYGGGTAVNGGALLLRNDARLANTTQVTVAPGAVFGGYGGVGGAVLNHGVLAVADAAPGFEGGPAGTFVIGGALVNHGEIRMGSPVPASTLVVNGDYTGNNGWLTLYTSLGDDNAATDRLVVRGNTAGQTMVVVRNAGGAGARTMNGIRVVQVDGRSDGTFALDGRLVAGAYEYGLYKGTPTGEDGNWYLRTISADPDPAPAPAPVPVPRPETGLWLANQSTAQAMFVHTFRDRAGFVDPRGADGGPANPSIGWARLAGGHADGNAAGGRIAESADSVVAQAGVDLLHRVSAGQRWQAGLMVGYGSATTHATTRNNPAVARGSVDGGSAGLYGTWHGNADGTEGPYVDTWFQYGHFDNKVRGQSLGEEAYASHVWSGSLEAGWAFPVGYTGQGRVQLEPQAQLIYTDYHAGSHTERNGTVVQSQRSGGVSTRLGARLFHVPTAPDATAWLPYLELNWWHAARGDAVAFNHIVVAQDGPSDRVEVKVGAQARLGQHWRLWGNLAYQYGNGGYERIGGLLGVRYQW